MVSSECSVVAGLDILDTLPMGLVVLDRSYRVQGWNHWMVLHSSKKREDVLGHSVFNFYPELNRPSFLRACKTVFTFGNVVYLSQKLHRFLFPFPTAHSSISDFETMQQSCTMSPVRGGDDGTVTHVAISVQDVTDAVILEQRLRRVNSTDELTGVYNRRYLDQRLAEEFDRHRRYQRSLSIVIFDLDHFKQTNDTYGHLAGDHALVEVRRIARENLRDIDVLARFGGEEFVCVLPETDCAAAVAVAERLRAAMEAERFSWKEQPFRITASFGVAEIREDMQCAGDLLEAADGALYRAKINRNTVVTA